MEQSEVVALSHTRPVKEIEDRHQCRLLTDIQSVVTFHGLPKKQIKPSGQIFNALLEEFDMNLYKPRANFNGFRTYSWILAYFEVLYDRLGKTDEYLFD